MAAAAFHLAAEMGATASPVDAFLAASLEPMHGPGWIRSEMGMQGLERRTVNEKRESGGGKGWVHWCVVVHGGLFVTTDGRVMFCAFQGRSRLLPWWRVSLEKQLLHRAGHRSSTPPVTATYSL